MQTHDTGSSPQKRIKVFHIISHIAMGGAERVAVNIATSPSSCAEHHVIEVLHEPDTVTGSLMEELHNAGAHVHQSFFRRHKLGMLLFPLHLLMLMIRYKADIIHTHTEIPDASVYLWYMLFGRLFPHTRYIRTIHNTELWTAWKGIGKRVEVFFQQKNANIAIGRGTAQSYLLAYGKSAPIIPNGVREVAQRTFPGLVAGACNVLFAGRMEPQKGIAALIETVKLLANRREIVFHIIGSGTLRTKIEIELGSLPTVHLYDKIPGLASCLGGIDYVFMPSEFEGLVLFSLEASLAGVPVLANRCPGLEETLPPDWPLMAERNDTNTYIRLLTTPLSAEQRASLAEHARAYARAHYSISSMRAGYERIYLLND